MEYFPIWGLHGEGVLASALRDLHLRWGCVVALSASISRGLEPSLFFRWLNSFYIRV
ncbi:MAG: hypothetical protein ACO2PN_17340 [Pyrobaculum sp.]